MDKKKKINLKKIQIENVFQYLDELCHKMQQSESYFSIAYLDLDKWKNNSVSLTELIEDFMHNLCKVPFSKCFYIGRDEFFVVLIDTKRDIALSRLHEFKQIWKENRLFDITFSAGLVSFPYHGTTSEQLWRRAEEGLYRAKRGGRDLICQPEDDSQVLKSNYYYKYQLDRLKQLAQKTGRKEADILRSALDEYFRKYDEI